jgi:hypothetical protein
MANIDFSEMAYRGHDRARSIWDQSTPNDADLGEDTLDWWCRSLGDWRWLERDASTRCDLAGSLQPLEGDPQAS